MLEPVGISPAAETLFRRLLARPRSSLAELTLAADQTADELCPLLHHLEQSGLVVRTAGSPPRFVPALPDLAIERLVLRRQEELEQVREAALRLSAEFRQAAAAPSEEIADVITGREAVAHHARQIQLTATRDVLVADRPPYAEAGQPGWDREELELLARGIAYRRVYHRPALALAEHVAHLEAYLAAGEQSRVLHDVPLKMLVVDRRRALVPLDPGAQVYDAALLVHAAPLVEALVLCFEAMWERAVHVKAGEPHYASTEGAGEAAPMPAAQDRQLLTLLASGLKDEAVARQLRLSSRTVVRRVDRLMKELGADTRFQAGLQAVRRGWL